MSFLLEKHINIIVVKITVDCLTVNMDPWTQSTVTIYIYQWQYVSICGLDCHPICLGTMISGTGRAG